MIAVIVFLFILGLLIMVHEFGHFIAARKVGVRVNRFSIGFGPRLFKRKKSATEYSLSALPFGGYVELAGDSIQEYKGGKDEYFSKPVGKRFWIIFSGPLLNYFLGIICLWVIFIIGYPMLTTKVGGLIDGFGAQKAGIKVGDKIVSVDGKLVTYWEDLQREIHRKNDLDSVGLLILRDGKEVNITVDIRQKNLEDEFKQKKKVGLLGVTPADEIVSLKYGPVKSLVVAFNKTVEITVLTLKGLYFMVSGKIPIRDSVTGPLGIFMITSKAASLGIVAVLHLVAILSISLAIFNLLPLPILDGGHIFLLGVEKIRGRTVSARVEQIITRVGITFILLLAVMVTYNDIVRIFGAKIAKFIGR